MGRTGEVTLRDFDNAAVLKLGATLAAASIGEDSTEKLRYGVAVDSVSGPLSDDRCPVFFERPGFTSHYALPCFVVRRTAIELDTARFQVLHHLGYRKVPADDAVEVEVALGELGEVVVVGYDKYVQRVAPVPYNFNYIFEVRAPRRSPVVDLLLAVMLRRLRPNSNIAVVDSLDETRWYDFLIEGGLEDQGEIVDVLERTSVFSTSARIVGELDQHDEVTVGDGEDVRQVLGAPVFDVTVLED